MDRIELDKAFIELLTPEIVLISTKENSIVDIKDIQEMKKINLKLTAGKNYGVITNPGKYASITEKGRKYISTEGIERNKIASAFVINSLAQRLLFNFFIKFNRPNIPSKSFSNLINAREWMHSQLENATHLLV